MKSRLVLLGVPLVLSSLLAQPSGKQGTLVFIHVTVIDATGSPAKGDSTVVIVGDRIAQIGTGGDVLPPENAEVIDGTGKFLIPGLWDMHTHTLYYKEDQPLFIANGVTGIRVMWGFPMHHEWRKEIEAGTLLGPRMLIASSIIDGPKPRQEGSISVANASEARLAVIKSKGEGADFIKVYEYLPRDAYFAIADEAKKQGIPFVGHVPLAVTAEEASNAGQRVFEHLLSILPACSIRSEEWSKAARADLAEEIESGKSTITWGSHIAAVRQSMLDGYDAGKAAALFELLRKNGTWQCPTLTVLHMIAFADDPSLGKDPRLKYLPLWLRSEWDTATLPQRMAAHGYALVYQKKEFKKDLEVVGSMQRAGVGILAGTDSPNPYCFVGFSLHDELGLLVEAGLSPMEALQAATRNPAEFFGWLDGRGTIEP